MAVINDLIISQPKASTGGGGGISEEQASAITQTLANTNTLITSVGEVSPNGNIVTMLNNVVANLQNVLEKLEIPETNFQPTEPYDPPPETIYTTREKRKSPFIYQDISQPRITQREYFTINDNQNVIVKTEFDVESDLDESNIEIIIRLSDDEVINDDIIRVNQGANHITLTGVFKASRTDYYLSIEINYVSTVNKVTVSNICYEVVGDNICFLSYEPKYFVQCSNFDYYITKVDYETGTVGYFTTNVLNPDLNQPYTIIAQDKGYLYKPLLDITYKNSTNDFSVFRNFYIIRQDLATRKCEALAYNGTSPITVDNSTAIGWPVFSTYCTNNQSGSKVIRYSQQDHRSYLFTSTDYGNGRWQFLASGNTIYDSSVIETLVDISVANSFRSYKKSYLGYDYTIATTKKGQNYACQINKYNKDCPLGFGTRVEVGEIPNYRGELGGTASLTRMLRAFIYVYDHWKVIYYTHLNATFKIYGVETISGEYEQLLPGFNGDYFGVKDGELIRFQDSNVIPETIAVT